MTTKGKLVAELDAAIADTKKRDEMTVLGLRMRRDELEQVEAVAKKRGLPTSTFAKLLLFSALKTLDE